MDCYKNEIIISKGRISNEINIFLKDFAILHTVFIYIYDMYVISFISKD